MQTWGKDQKWLTAELVPVSIAATNRLSLVNSWLCPLSEKILLTFCIYGLFTEFDYWSLQIRKSWNHHSLSGSYMLKVLFLTKNNSSHDLKVKTLFCLINSLEDWRAACPLELKECTADVATSLTTYVQNKRFGEEWVHLLIRL